MFGIVPHGRYRVNVKMKVKQFNPRTLVYLGVSVDGAKNVSVALENKFGFQDYSVDFTTGEYSRQAMLWLWNSDSNRQVAYCTDVTVTLVEALSLTSVKHKKTTVATQAAIADCPSTGSSLSSFASSGGTTSLSSSSTLSNSVQSSARSKSSQANVGPKSSGGGSVDFWYFGFFVVLYRGRLARKININNRVAI